LEGLDERIDRRNWLASSYREALSAIPGITFPAVARADRSTYKDFTVLVDADGFGIAAADLAEALAAEGIQTRRYYTPPVHAMQAYRSLAGTNGHLPVTERACTRVLTLPLWGAMTENHIERVVSAVARIHGALERVKLQQ
jgi:dTDP-4-amino-4,6-dideoxygalactose transaminase